MSTCFFLICTILHLLQNTCQANNVWEKSVRFANANEFEFVVSIGLKNYGYHKSIPVPICSGVLITKKHIITSAHCMKEVKNLTDVRVKLGWINLQFADKYRIKSWTTYTLWAKDNNIIPEPYEHDISILKLDKNVDSSTKPATTTNNPNTHFYGKSVETAFWGIRDRVAEFVKIAALNVISNSECTKMLNQSPLVPKNLTVDRTYMCTKLNVGAVLENVDSGSPLLISGKEVIGINDPTYLQRKGIHAPVNVNFHLGIKYYRNFIDSVIKTETAKWWKLTGK